MNTRMVSLLLLLAIAGLTSCIGQDPPESAQDAGLTPILHFDFGQPMGMTRAEYADLLTQEAVELAKTELARLSAIELMYRNKTYLHKFRWTQGPDISGLAYAKVYRQFTDYKLVDITSSKSIFSPFLLKIDFDYDILTTELVETKGRDHEKALTAHSLKTYTVSRSATTRLVYSCDEKGQLLALPPPLPRLNVFDDVGGRSDFIVYGLEEALGPNAGLEIPIQ